jgi:RNA polymerase sigma-70 factor (ECF subfamily)
MDEQQLIASVQGGTLSDFDPLYRQYVDPIYRFIYRRTLERMTAEDLTSVTFMKALEKIGTYDPSKGVFGAWLYRIARNSITDHYRTHRPHEDIEDVWDLSSADDVAMDTNDRLMYDKLKDALQKLGAEKREIVTLRLWEGLSYKEIAALTGKTETNCKVIFSRTIDQLRKEVPLTVLLLLLLSPFSL